MVALAVSTSGAPALAAPLETAIAAALTRRGFSVTPLRGAELADATGAARRLRADRLLRIAAGLAPGSGELWLSVEDQPTRPSFFLQHALGVLPGGGQAWSQALPVDAATLALARHGSSSLPLAARPLWRVSERVLALAGGDPAGDGSVAFAVVTPTALLLYDRGGALLARHDLGPAGQVRRPAATVAIGDFPGGRIALQLAGGKPGEVLAFHDGALWPVGTVAAAPLAAVGRQRVFGAFLPSRATLADLLAPSAELSVERRSGRDLVAFAAAPRPGRIAFAGLYGDGSLQLLGPDLASSGAPLAGIGAGFALADLDGDGEPELVASSTEPGASDRLRVLRLGADGAEPIFESPPIAGSVLAGGAADLTGDGIDDALLASVAPSGESRLWLVTTDSRQSSSAGGTAR